MPTFPAITVLSILLSSSQVAQVSSPVVRYRDPIAAEVEVSRDLLYKTASDYTGKKVGLRLDVYRPKGDRETSRPAVIFVHGGALSMGSKDSGGMERQMVEGLAKRGYVVVSIDYRLRPDPNADFNGAMMDAMTDTQSSLAWLRQTAVTYGVDRTRIILAGYSAGAEIITNLCYTPFVKDMDPRQVLAIVDVAGNTLFYGDPAPGAPPCLIVHGTRDSINPLADSQKLRERLLKKGVSCELVGIQDASHFFTSPGDQEALEQAVVKFLYKQVVKP